MRRTETFGCCKSGKEQSMCIFYYYYYNIKKREKKGKKYMYWLMNDEKTLINIEEERLRQTFAHNTIYNT